MENLVAEKVQKTYIYEEVLEASLAYFNGDELAATTWIKKYLGLEYAWPGNVRELEQCLRNIMIRGTYSAPSATPAHNSENILFQELKECRLTADKLLNIYCKNTYNKTGSYLATAKILNLDRRTVKKRISEVK